MGLLLCKAAGHDISRVPAKPIALLEPHNPITDSILPAPIKQTRVPRHRRWHWPGLVITRI